MKRAVFRQTSDGEERKDMPRLSSPGNLRAAGAALVVSAEPQSVANGLLITTGEVPRTTDYETGFPGHRSLIAGDWVDDSALIDDTALVARVRGRGLVIVSGCSHAGIVNITRHAQSVTGEKRVAGIVGGLHLEGPDDKRSIQTFRDLKVVGPEILVPCHCTGDGARFLARDAMPSAYTPSSVGTMYVIET
jgi:7,8-dihydropterin-6-yl-methyl-4-(beta-D-ribofuranosyl)aminobenzene 5'-phosphate synthase